MEDISVGDTIRLDIDTLDHGIETVTVTRVGTKANQTNLTEDVTQRCHTYPGPPGGRIRPG